MKKILIVKLGALGDVIRTIPLVSAIKKKYPDSEITWVTKKDAAEILKGNEIIDKVLVLPYQKNKEFDVLYNFDIEDEATSLASKIKAKEKYGFYLEGGYVRAFNLGAEYYLNTLFDDELKKNNRKTYQEMMFEAAETPYEKEPYKIFLTSEELENGKKFVKENNLTGRKIIGIHMGAASRWPSKAWAEEKVKEFIILAKESGKEILLFGGPNEIKKHEKITKELDNEGIKVYRNNPENTLKEFVSLVNVCDAVVCSDSLALHVAIGLQKKTVGLFFCTSPYEVESYHFLEKIKSPLLEKFFPEKMDQYSEELTKSINAEEVLSCLTE